MRRKRRKMRTGERMKRKYKKIAADKMENKTKPR